MSVFLQAWAPALITNPAGLIVSNAVELILGSS